MILRRVDWLLSGSHIGSSSPKAQRGCSTELEDVLPGRVNDAEGGAARDIL